MSDNTKDASTQHPPAPDEQGAKDEGATVHRLYKATSSSSPAQQDALGQPPASAQGESLFERLNRAALGLIEQERQARTSSPAINDDTASAPRVRVSSLEQLRQASSKELPTRGWLKTPPPAAANHNLDPMPLSHATPVTQVPQAAGVKTKSRRDHLKGK